MSFAPSVADDQTTTRPDRVDGDVVPSEVIEQIRAQARDIDAGEQSTRSVFPRLGAEGLLELGAPLNAGGRLPEMVEVVTRVAAECMSTAFSLWATRMSIEYLRFAGSAHATKWADRLATGEVLGITGMASAFKDLAGCGSLELSAERVEGGYRVSGPIRWASNLWTDSLLVTAARDGAGRKLVFAVPLDTPGITVGQPFSLMALGGTASSYLTLEDVQVTDAQVLTHDVDGLLSAVRPTFLVLQSAMCLGLAGTSIAQARDGAVGINDAFGAAVDLLRARHTLASSGVRSLAQRVGTEQPPARAELLALRLSAAEIASEAAALELRTAGGRGFASASPASRRFREASFIPVQSPSEGQLRWELAAGR